VSEPLLEVSGLTVDYLAERGDVRAVDHVSVTVAPGEFLGIVGESGCGKSTLLFAISQLLSPPARLVSGEVVFAGRDLVHLDKDRLRSARWRDFSLVMQSAMNALNPMKSIGAQFKDALDAHASMSRAAVAERSAEVLRMVGIDPIHTGSYPHQLSGGMRQRAMIAMALLFTPQLVIMDEPTSALDVVAQRALMGQIKDLQTRLGFAVIFVTHDMSTVSHYSDRVMVMYAGQVEEVAGTERIFSQPLHPYTRGLMEAFPSVRGPRRPLTGIPGAPPNLSSPPSGCRFHPRCPKVMPQCRETDPEFYTFDGTQVRCLLYAPAQADERAA
jgi:peptide/nickel transport system ATP-binding protein